MRPLEDSWMPGLPGPEYLAGCLRVSLPETSESTSQIGPAEVTGVGVICGFEVPMSESSYARVLT